MIKKDNKIAMLEAANKALQEEEKHDEDIMVGKKRINDIFKLFKKIESTMPEIQRITDEMMEIKEQ